MKSKLVNFSIVFIAVIILIETLQKFQSFLRPFVVALILTFLIMPLVRWCRRKKVPLWVILGAIVLGFAGLIAVVGLLLQTGGSEVDTLESDEDKIEQGVQSFEEIISQITIAGQDLGLEKFVNREKIQEFVSTSITFALTAIRTISAEFLLILLFLLFILPSYEIFIRDMEKYLKSSKARKFKSALLEIEKSIVDYLVTKTGISLGTGVVSGILLFLFNAKFVIVLALLIFVLNFIPNIGSFIAVTIALISYGLTTGIDLSLLWLGVLLIIVQIIFGAILEPKIAGNKLNLSPIVILLGLFLWGWIWGIVGMLLAVPLTSIMKIILGHIEGTKMVAKFMS